MSKVYVKQGMLFSAEFALHIGFKGRGRGDTRTVDETSICKMRDFVIALQEDWTQIFHFPLRRYQQ